MDTTKLHEAYANNVELAAICDVMAARQNNQTETKLHSMLTIVNRDPANAIRKWKLIAAFRELEVLGCGQYVEGRHGHPSRFVWNAEYGSSMICRAAQGQPIHGNPETVSDDTDKASDLLDHYFNLRVDYLLELTLPVDLTASEAERLACFIRSLPLSEF